MYWHLSFSLLHVSKQRHYQYMSIKSNKESTQGEKREKKITKSFSKKKKNSHKQINPEI